MLYLAIDQHRKQLTVNLRNEEGDVTMKRQVSTEWKRVREFLEEVRNQSLPEGGFVAIVEVCGFNDWFLKMKDTSRYLLYPKTGIHWSSYGAFLAFDSLTRYLGARLNEPLVRIRCNHIQVTGDARGRDADIEQGLNLIGDISRPPMAYPSVVFEKKAGTVFPSALFIGDSFYYTWSENGYIANTFTGRDFWYYDHEVYSGSFNTGKKTRFLNLVKEITGKQVIILLQTNAGNGSMGYGFVDRMLALME